MHVPNLKINYNFVLIADKIMIDVTYNPHNRKSSLSPSISLETLRLNILRTAAVTSCVFPVPEARTQNQSCSSPSASEDVKFKD